MSSSTIKVKINGRLIGILALSISAIVFILFLLHRYDEKRKFQLFLSLQQSTLKSPHLEKLTHLSENFTSKNDTNFNKIRWTLSDMQEAEHLDYVQLLIPEDGHFLVIRGNLYTELKYEIGLDKKEELVLELLKTANSEKNYKEVYQIIKEDRRFWTITDLKTAYLITQKYKDR